MIETDADVAAYRSVPSALHRGEAVSLALATARGWTFLTDDADARRATRQLGVPLGGTLGVLTRLVRSRYLTIEEANVLLAGMIERAKYRSPVSDLRSLNLE